MLKICPNCNQRFAWNPNQGPDYIHRCYGAGSARNTESVLKTGDWEDYTGSGTVKNVNFQGIATKASGRRTGIDNIDTKNVHGKRSALYRTRQHLEYIDIND